MVDKLPENYTGIVEYSNGIKSWLVNGKLHREDGPAVEYPGGVKKWFFRDKLHRIGGPAVIFPNGRTEYWLDGRCLQEESWQQEVAKLKNPCDSKTIEFEGKKYKLVEI